jgi:hypothetical protein
MCVLAGQISVPPINTSTMSLVSVFQAVMVAAPNVLDLLRGTATLAIGAFKTGLLVAQIGGLAPISLLMETEI